MKKIILGLASILLIGSAHAQQNLDELLAAGVADAQRFATSYITPAAEGLLWNTTTGWQQGAKVKKSLGFEFSIIGVGTLIKDQQKSFTLNVNDYENIDRFDDGTLSKDVATAFGENDPNASNSCI